MHSQLKLTRQQILAFRRRVGGLEERSPPGPASLERAAWAGLQDSMPRAALLSLHARVEGVEHSAWDDASLTQLWGPRYNTYVVAEARLRAVLAREASRTPRRAAGAPRRRPRLVNAHLDGRRLTDREVAGALGIGNAIRYAATTGTVAIRWEGARAPVVWTVAAADIDPADACRELARRYLHIFGPATAQGFARWAGISRRAGAAAFASLEAIARGRSARRSATSGCWRPTSPRCAPGRRATPPRACCRAGMRTSCSTGRSASCSSRPRSSAAQLWTSRVWPGALLVDGEIRGTWRRANQIVRIGAWTKLSPGARDAVEGEARSLPLPGLDREIEVVWEA